MTLLYIDNILGTNGLVPYRRFLRVYKVVSVYIQKIALMFYAFMPQGSSHKF